MRIRISLPPPAQTYGHFIHRPLSTYLNDLIDQGCTLRKIIEPQLDETIASEQGYERYAHVPGQIVIYAIKLNRNAEEPL